MDPIRTTIKTYGAIAQDYTDAYFDYYKEDKAHVDAFITLLSPQARVLEAGCGPGGIVEYFHSQGFVVTGIDLSPEMIAIAKKRVPDAAYEVMDLRDMKFPDTSFDGIISSYSFIHVPERDADGTLAGFHRVLTDSGLLFLAIEEGEGEYYFDEPFKPGSKIFMKFYTKEDITKRLKNAGFELVYFVREKTKADEPFLTHEFFIIAKKI
jgi:ubiquinone/menaquinone biosynthesis C-methylase UbiE